jgi:lysophospholipase L1-like esterase
MTPCAGTSGAFSDAPVPPGLPLSRLFGSLALLPLVALQAQITRRRVPRLASAKPPHHGTIAGVGRPIRILATGESSVSGVGLASGEETVAAATARSLARLTNRPATWRTQGRSGATVREGIDYLLPCLASEPADLLIVAFGVNDVMALRSPSRFADDLEEFITAARDRIGEAAVVVGGVAPVRSFPALRSPLSNVLGWWADALQAAAEGLTRRLPRLVVQRLPPRLEPERFAVDGFHINAQAHALWGEDIAALVMPLL